MAILNYTTEVSTEKTVGEIQSRLAKAKAQAVLTEYDGTGLITHLSFKVDTKHGIMAFRLPANIEAILKIIKNSAKVPYRLKTREQAARVAWRIIFRWVEAQLAIIETEMVTIDQVFLPYMQSGDGQTFYQSFEKHGLKALSYDKGVA